MKTHLSSIRVVSILIIAISLFLFSCTNSRYAQTSTKHLDYVKKDIEMKNSDTQTSTIQHTEEMLSTSAGEIEPIITNKIPMMPEVQLKDKEDMGNINSESSVSNPQRQSDVKVDKKANKASQSTITQLLDSGSTNGMAIAALIMGILALVAFYGAFLFALLAIIFGAIALGQINKKGQGGKGMAIAGLVMGIVGAALWAILLAVVIGSV